MRKILTIIVVLLALTTTAQTKRNYSKLTIWNKVDGAKVVDIETTIEIFDNLVTVRFTDTEPIYYVKEKGTEKTDVIKGVQTKYAGYREQSGGGVSVIEITKNTVSINGTKDVYFFK
ncbi:MAG: hypothetical protein Q7T12_00495 [Flavobacterium sp.]|nr:hypothetical protein [Flavobacterium sp.]